MINLPDPFLLFDAQQQTIHWPIPTRIDLPMSVVIPPMKLYTEAQMIAYRDAVHPVSEPLTQQQIKALAAENKQLREGKQHMIHLQEMLIRTANKLDEEADAHRRELDRVKFLGSLQRARAEADINELTEANERMRKELTKFMHKEELLLDTVCIMHRELWAVEGAELQWSLVSETLKKFNELDKE